MPQDADQASQQGPFQLGHKVDLVPLRRSLEAAGYTEAGIGRILLRRETGEPRDLAVALRRTAGGTPFHTLVRLFMLAQAVPEDAVRAALAPVNLEGLVALGLLRRCPEGVRAEATLMPSDELLLVRELWPDYAGRPLTRDFVLGVGSASRIVACLTVRRQGELVLDVGTGGGFLGLLAGRHARQVIATDVNPRALNFAALNARLNEVANIEFRLGSLFEPVAGCRFDLIVANPPFVIAPRARYEYRNSGLQGDTISERLIRGAPGMLRQGGYCSVLFNWHHQNDDDWAERPRQWLADNGCDAWLTCFETFDPVGYAATWLEEDHGHDSAAYACLLDEWVTYLEGLRIGRVSFGAVILRRGAGAGWIRSERAPSGPPQQSCSEQIQRIFAAEDFLREHQADEDLLSRAFALTEDHQLEHVLRREENRWVLQGAQLKQTRGYPFVGNVDRLVSTVLAGCDGRHTLSQLATELAAGSGAEFSRIAPGCCNIIRTLLHCGFLRVGEP